MEALCRDCKYASDNVTLEAKNFTAANGRIVDVDIAAESTNLAKYNILAQASASMIAQANSSMDMALMLLKIILMLMAHLL